MIHFYCYHNEKKIIVSDFPLERVKNRFGHKFEILTSVKDRQSIAVVTPRILRSYPNFIIKEHLMKSKPRMTEEAKRKISLSKLGKPRDEETKRKISLARKGKSNFEGKKHKEESKRLIALGNKGNQFNRGSYWAHDPKTGKEIRVKTKADIPPGYVQGRDYYAIEPGRSVIASNKLLRAQAATNSPTETQSNKDLVSY